MPKWKILAVDDEVNLLFLIRELLGSEECLVETAIDSSSAWEKLNNSRDPFSLIILDRMMPGIDGLELLRRIKADSRFQAIPVIMLSGAISPEQIAEGIEAGAYHYLTKPYKPKALKCVVRSVMNDIEARNRVASQATEYLESLRHFTRAELCFSTLEDVNHVAGILSAMCPDPEQVSSGMVELLLNAVEHGNLGITYDEKKQLMFDDRWEPEIRRRLALPEYSGRLVRVTFERRDTALIFQIRDEGSGFDWESYLEFDPRRSLDPNGRGIAMSRRNSFSTVEFQGFGNVVTATVSL